MTDKFEEFMKKNTPEAAGGLKTLELPRRSNWMMGLALSGALAATIVITTINRPVVEDTYFDEFSVTFDDEFPDDVQVAEMMFEEI